MFPNGSVGSPHNEHVSVGNAVQRGKDGVGGGTLSLSLLLLLSGFLLEAINRTSIVGCGWVLRREGE